MIINLRNLSATTTILNNLLEISLQIGRKQNPTLPQIEKDKRTRLVFVANYTNTNQIIQFIRVPSLFQIQNLIANTFFIKRRQVRASLTTISVNIAEAVNKLVDYKFYSKL